MRGRSMERLLIKQAPNHVLKAMKVLVMALGFIQSITGRH